MNKEILIVMLDCRLATAMREHRRMCILINTCESRPDLPGFIEILPKYRLSKHILEERLEYIYHEYKQLENES